MAPIRRLAPLLLVASLSAASGASAQSPADARPGKAAKKKRAPGVRGMFDAAQELYDAGKYNDALAAYAAILKKYPGHEPAIIQTAKTLYRLDRIKEAFNVFARLNPQHLDPETSYEYGWSFYTNKAWDGALYAFQRVPKGHALYDLANYYGGICAIKLKKYDDAEDMLEKAVVLPDKLAKSRALYIKHVQALRLMQQKNALARDRDREQESLNDARKKPKKGDASAAKDAKPAADQPYVHQGFKTVTKSADVKYTEDHQYYDDFGYKQSTFEAKITDFDLLSGFIIPLPFKSGKFDGKDRQAAFGLQLTGNIEDRISHGTEQRILANESNADLTRLANKDLGITDLKSGTVDAEAWLELPLPQNVWIDGGGEVNFTYPDFERGQRTGYRRGYFDLDGRISTTASFGAQAAYMEILDPQTEPIITVVTGKGVLELQPLSKLTVDLKGQYDVYTYLAADANYQQYLAEGLNLDGPDSIITGELKVTQEFPLGFKLALTGDYQNETNYIFHGIPSFDEVSANGDVYTGKASLILVPPVIPWFSAQVTELVQKTQWQLSNPAAQDPFQVNTPDYLEEFTAWVAINLAF